MEAMDIGATSRKKRSRDCSDYDDGGVTHNDMQNHDPSPAKRPFIAGTRERHPFEPGDSMLSGVDPKERRRAHATRYKVLCPVDLYASALQAVAQTSPARCVQLRVNPKMSAVWDSVTQYLNEHNVKTLPLRESCCLVPVDAEIVTTDLERFVLDNTGVSLKFTVQEEQLATNPGRTSQSHSSAGSSSSSSSSAYCNWQSEWMQEKEQFERETVDLLSTCSLDDLAFADYDIFPTREPRKASSCPALRDVVQYVLTTVAYHADSSTWYIKRKASEAPRWKAETSMTRSMTSPFDTMPRFANCTWVQSMSIDARWRHALFIEPKPENHPFQVTFSNVFKAAHTMGLSKSVCRPRIVASPLANKRNDTINLCPELPFDVQELRNNRPTDQQIKEFEDRIINDYLLKVLCSNDKPEWNFLIDYIAHIIQCPENLPNCMIVLCGVHGCAKSTVGRLIEAMIGPALFTSMLYKEMASQFNLDSMYKLVYFIDELDPDFTLDSKLKLLITNPSRSIEAKGKNRFPVLNFGRYIAATNHESRPMIVEPTERRIMFIKSSDYFTCPSKVVELDGLYQYINSPSTVRTARWWFGVHHEIQLTNRFDKRYCIPDSRGLNTLARLRHEDMVPYMVLFDIFLGVEPLTELEMVTFMPTDEFEGKRITSSVVLIRAKRYGTKWSSQAQVTREINRVLKDGVIECRRGFFDVGQRQPRRRSTRVGT